MDAIEILKGEREKMTDSAFHTVPHPCQIATSYWSLQLFVHVHASILAMLSNTYGQPWVHQCMLMYETESSSAGSLYSRRVLESIINFSEKG